MLPTNEQDTPFKFGYTDDTIFLAVGSVIQTFMVDDFEITGMFTTTFPTFDLESLPRIGINIDFTTGSVILTGGSTGGNVVLTVMGIS
jgi:hypothetical protein